MRQFAKEMKRFTTLMFWSVVLCHASVTYTFTGTTASGFPIPVENESFQLTSPSFLFSVPEPSPNTAFLIFTSSQLDSCVGCPPTGLAVGVQPDNCGGDGHGNFINCSDTVEYSDVRNNAGSIYYFPLGALTSAGVFHTTALGSPNNNVGTLTVTGAPDSTTPEPSTALLMMIGVFLVTAARRRIIRGLV
jgi:hypothetical protein